MQPAEPEREVLAERPKWNSILKSDEQDRIGKLTVPPQIQSNHRSRSESVPEIRTTPETTSGLTITLSPSDKPDEMNLESSLLLSGTEPNSLSKMLDISLKWNQNDSSTISPLSPLRSPIVADWKAVGSPIATAGQDDETMFEGHFSEVVNNGESPEGKSRICRQRAMSLIEKGVFFQRSISPFDFEKLKMRNERLIPKEEGHLPHLPDPANDPSIRPASPDKLNLTGPTNQVAQLPKALHEELGVENADEATEIFKRSSMDSLRARNTSRSAMDSDSSPGKQQPLSSMPSLFCRMPFGPAAMVFGLENQQPQSTVESVENDSLDELKSIDGGHGRRHSSRELFGIPSDWQQEVSPEFSVDDYFASSTLSRCHPRRHSIAAPSIFTDVDEHLGSLSLSSSQVDSSLSPSAASFNFRGYGSQSTSSLLDYMSMTASNEDFGNANCPRGSGNYQQISSASMREVSFQLSTYKGPLYAVEFKAGRTEIFYVLEIDGKPQMKVRVGDLVIVEADRGEDLGKVTVEISVEKLKQLMMPGSEVHNKNDKDSDILTPELAALVHSKEIVPKRIHRLAQNGDLKLLQAKAQEEAIAMVRCQSRIRQKKLPMEVVDAEYQWDRNKLTFYFCADRRIDFRELVRDLFRIYKTRIWMCAVDKSSPRMVMYTSASGTGGSGPLCVGGNSTLSSCDLSSPPAYFAFGGGHPDLS